MTKEQRANQWRWETIGVCIRQNTDLLIAQTVEIIAGRVDPECDGDVGTSCEAKSIGVDFPGV